MAKKNKESRISYSDAEVEIVSKALNRTWQVIAHDVLALTDGKPLSREEVLDATIDYVDTYGRLDAAGKKLFGPGCYSAIEAVLERVFKFKTYGL